MPLRLGGGSVSQAAPGTNIQVASVTSESRKIESMQTLHLSPTSGLSSSSSLTQLAHLSSVVEMPDPLQEHKRCEYLSTRNYDRFPTKTKKKTQR